MRRTLLAAAVAAIAATAALLGGALRSEPAPAALDRRAEAHSLVVLGLELEQQARQTFDSSYYARAEQAFRQASELDPSDPVAVRGLATVALNRHEFRRALGLARRARALAPELAATHGTIGDALVELGRYEEAFASFDRYAERKPGFAAYVRVAYAQELLGRTSDAEATMQLALAAVPTGREPIAWTLTQLGKLRFGTGDVAGAAREYRRALRVLPKYVPAREGLALTEAAQGRPRRGIAVLAPVAETTPLPQAAATLGDLYLIVGESAAAARQDGLLRVEERLLASRGVRNDLETASLDVDRGIRLRESLAALRRVHAERPSIDADDALGWALVRNGRCAEGLRYATRALRLGTRDATKLFHRGMAERCLGDEPAARRTFRLALATNPHFSLRWAPVARRYAR
ncbi:MAG TPA: tetratricopeptide repeat protein [Gaiellaceae bacterium]|nr:tetratricopeptide repeat protein [Gaiellaceae bacterium]